MLKSTESGQLLHYIRSLREIESLLVEARGGQASNAGGRGAPGLPEHWQEVVHMARIAPALLLCLRECRSLLDQTYRTLAVAGEPFLSEGQHSYLETMKNVLASCEHAIEVASTGPIPPSQTLH